MIKNYVKGKEYIVNTTDEKEEKCDVVSFYTHSDDVHFDDGTTTTDLKTKVDSLNNSQGTQVKYTLDGTTLTITTI